MSLGSLFLSFCLQALSFNLSCLLTANSWVLFFTLYYSLYLNWRNQCTYVHDDFILLNIFCFLFCPFHDFFTPLCLFLDYFFSLIFKSWSISLEASHSVSILLVVNPDIVKSYFFFYWHLKLVSILAPLPDNTGKNLRILLF